MEKNKTGKYLKYAIGEIILVVIGILVALQINNWNETRKLNDLKQVYYQQILVDLEIDKNYAEYVINRLDSSLTKYNNYLETYKQPYKDFTKIIQNIEINDLGTLNLEFKTSTIKTIINIGDIKLLEPNLRDKLTLYNASKTQTLNLSNVNNVSANYILQNAAMSGAGTYLRLQVQPELVNFLEFEGKFPRIFLELEAYFAWRNFGEKGTIKSLNVLIEDADIIIDFINKESEE